MDQNYISLTYKEAKTKAKGTFAKKWSSIHPQHYPKDSIYSLPRKDQVIIFRLRTGHCRLRHHLYTKFRIGTSGMCPCGRDNMTPEHVPQNCILHVSIRKEIWPMATDLEEKLHGDVIALGKTVTFVGEAGVLV